MSNSNRSIPEAQLQALCVEVAHGATLAEAARAAALNYDALKGRLSRARRPRSHPRDREILEAVTAAAATWEAQARESLAKAAGKGAPRALEELIRRLDRLGQDLEADDEPPTDRRAWVEWRLRQVRRWIVQETGGIARTRLLQTERELMTELRGMDDERPQSAAEILADLEADLQTWSDAEILAVHAEGLRRLIPGFSARDAG